MYREPPALVAITARLTICFFFHCLLSPVSSASPSPSNQPGQIFMMHAKRRQKCGSVGASVFLNFPHSSFSSFSAPVSSLFLTRHGKPHPTIAAKTAASLIEPSRHAEKVIPLSLDPSSFFVAFLAFLAFLAFSFAPSLLFSPIASHPTPPTLPLWDDPGRLDLVN